MNSIIYQFKVAPIESIKIDRSFVLMSEGIRFYRMELTDQDGNSLEDIWNFNHEEYENGHNFIQWMFPSDEPSSVNPHAPIVDKYFQTQFDQLRPRLMKSYVQFLQSIGVEAIPSLKVLDPERFDRRVRNYNHNLLRITRVIRSLTLLGFQKFAREFYEFLVATKGSNINTETLDYWKNALRPSEDESTETDAVAGDVMKIEFKSPHQQIVGEERRSKLLDPKSRLYQWLLTAKSKLQRHYPHAIQDRMDFHVELVKKGETWSKELLNERSSAYQNTEIDPLNCIKVFHNALVLECPDTFKYGHGEMHITIAYFPQGVPKSAHSLVLSPQ